MIALYWPMIRRVLPYLALSLAIWGAWWWTYSAGKADVQARWDAERAAVAAEAARAEAAAKARLQAHERAAADAASRYTHAQTENDKLAARNADLLRRLRNSTLRPRPVPGAPADPGGTVAAPGPGPDAGRAIADLGGFATRCARDRDGLADQVTGLIDGWPR